jgi:histidine ammonia-lyase
MIELADRSDFTLESYRRVAWGGEAVVISSEARERIRERRAEMEGLLAASPDRLFYGTTTLPGDGVKRRLSGEEDAAYLQHVTNPAVTFGDPFPERVTRGVVFARLTNFIEGHGGVRPELASAIASLLDGEALPQLPSRGNTWEIFVGSHLYDRLAESLGGFATKEPMALVNGCSLATALASDVALAGPGRIDLAAQAMSAAAAALLAPPEHFAPEIAELWGDPDEAAAMEVVRGLLVGGSADVRPYQAPVSFRIIPRLLGQAYRAQAAAETAARTMLRAVSDSPVYVFPTAERPDGELWSNGGFFPAQAIRAIDGVAFALADLAHLAYHQTARLLDDEFAFGSAGGPDRPQGAALLAQIAALSQSAWAYDVQEIARPTLLPLSGTKQTDVGAMTASAWRKANEIGRALDSMLGILGWAASETFSLTGRAIPPGLVPFLELVRAHRPLDGPWLTLSDDLASLSDALTRSVYDSAPASSTSLQ